MQGYISRYFCTVSLSQARQITYRMLANLTEVKMILRRANLMQL